MWKVRREPSGKAVRHVIADDDTPLSFDRVASLWSGDTGFAAFFSEALAAAPFDAFFWETPPMNRDCLDRRFEYILADAPALAGVPAEPGAFTEHFAGTEDRIAEFANLGGDAWLIAPEPADDRAAYAHLAGFVRDAPAGQVVAFWRHVGDALLRYANERTTWLSTSGLGVCWLHARLDTSPKYYTHAPYRQPPDGARL